MWDSRYHPCEIDSQQPWDGHQHTGLHTRALIRHALEGCRPVVSWTPGPTRATSWVGHDKHGRTYRAEITQHGATSTFRVAKGTNGKLRDVRDDELTGDHAAIAKYSATVLQRYAQTGK